MATRTSRPWIPVPRCPAARFASWAADCGPHELRRPQVRFGEVEGAVVISSDDFLIARVPPGAASGPVVVSANGAASNPHQIKVAAPIAENLHPVTNPALDADGNIYVTFSGSRGQKVPVAIYKIDTNYNVKPFLAEMTNATAIAFDRVGQMYVSSRFDGTVYRVAPNGTMSTYAEGMGVATGIAFDRRRESLCRRSQRHHFQDRQRSPDFCVRHARAQRFRLPPGVWAARRSVCHRAHDLEFRFRLQDRFARQRFDFLPRAGAPAGTGL